jgi:plastocyanin
VGPSTVIVSTPGTSFTPATATIGVGGTVTWEFSGATHNVVFGAAAPAGGSIPDTRPGSSVSRQFTTAGSYEYQCTRHSGMQGRVIVQ